MGYEFTEETLKRFYADKIKCPVCGGWIMKNQLCYYEKNEKGDTIRNWDCHTCTNHNIKVRYQENVSELERLGLL